MSLESAEQKDQLQIEAPSASVDEIVRQLDMSKGEASISLGPVVVNEDGTLSRVSNWSSMTEAEKERTTRVLSKRNASRLSKLRALEAAGQLPGQVQAQDIQARGQSSHTEL